jgi:hypothetical protein
MARNEALVNNYLATGTTNLNGATAGTAVGGPTLLTSLVESGLSALVTLDAETDTITLEASWQVSNDDSTWVDVAPYNNAAFVVWATGTAGADAAVTKSLGFPDGSWKGWRYARVAVTPKVTDGLTADTYAIGYNYVKDDLAH